MLNVLPCSCKNQTKKKRHSIKKRKKRKRNEGRLLKYPDVNESNSQIFQIKYEKKLSTLTKSVLNSFQNKYLFYAIDDILYSFNFNLLERDNLLAILYSPVLLLQNNFSINFFDIWIDEIYIREVSQVNKFLTTNDQNLKQFKFSYITIKFLYKTTTSIKPQDTLW